MKSYYLFLIILVGLFHFYIPSDIRTDSAFVWPTADSFHAFERLQDSTFLQNDFFTNISSQTSPRTPYLIFINELSKFFATNYYVILYLLEWFLAIFFPIGVFLFFTKIYIKEDETDSFRIIKNTVLALLIAFSSSIFVLDHFRFAAWRAVPIWPVAQAIALCLAFYGGFFLLLTKKYYKVFGIILLQLAALIHSPNTILFLGMFVILMPDFKKMLKTSLLLTFTILPVFVLVKVLFGDSSFLSSTDFARLYVTEAPYHAHHYRPNHFDHHVSATIIIIFLLCAVAAKLLKNIRLFYLALIFASSYVGSILLQIIAYELPSRFFLVIGPVRFTQFGYFMIALIFAGCIAEILENKKFSQNFKQILSNLNYKFINITAIIILVTAYGVRAANIDNPQIDFKNKYSNLFTWIDNNTNKQDVFAAPLREYFDLMITVPIVAKRPIFYSGASPFIEKYFEEAIDRKELLYGSSQEWTHGGPEWFYCEKLSLKRVEQAKHKYQLDYLIMPNNCPSVETLKSLKIVFKDNKLTVFKVKNNIR